MRLKKEMTAKWLCLWANRKGMTIKKLAKATELGYMNVYRWLHGEHACSDVDLVNLLLALYDQDKPFEPGELHYALGEMGLSVEQFEAAVKAAGLKEAEPIKQLTDSLKKWQKEFTKPAQPAVALPPTFVERTTELTWLKRNLLQTPSQPVIIWGMAGSGKTTLAKAVIQDSDIQRTFWNGVLWASLGPEANPQQWLYHWCTLLKIFPKRSDDTTSMYAKLITEMSQPGKRYLGVLDDVWDYTQLQELLRPVQNLTWLCTTRDRTLITRFSNGQLMEVGSMSSDESRTLLRRLVGPAQLARASKTIEDELIELVARTPLAIELSGHLVRLRGWDYVLAAMRDERTRLLTLETGGALTREVSMRLALQVSYAALPPLSQDYFRRLGVFGYGHDFSGLMAGSLWGLPRADLSVAGLQMLGEKELWYLHDVGLLERNPTEQQANRFRLHTLIHDYARTLLREREEFDTWRNAYILLYSRWAFNLATFPAQLHAEWDNLTTAFTHACDLEQHEEAALLLASLHAFMLVRMDFRTLDAWLQHLETYWATLSPTAQGMWEHAKACRLYAGGRWQAAQIFRRRYFANPQAENRLKGALCILEADLCWRYQEWAAAEAALAEAAPFMHPNEPQLQRQYQQLVVRLAHHRGDFASLQDELSKLVHMIDAEPDPLEQGSGFLFVAELYRDSGNFDQAESYLNSTLEIARAHKMAAVEAAVLIELMQLHLQTERFAEGLRLSPRLLELLEHWPAGQEASERYAFVYQLMTHAYAGQDELTQALECAQTALPFATAAQNPLLMGRNFMLMGRIQIQRGAVTEAIAAYSAAIQHFEKAPELFDLLQMAAAEREQCYRLRNRSSGA